MGLMLGIKAGVGSTYNYAGKIAHKIYEAARKKDFKTASYHQIFLQKMWSMFFDEGLYLSSLEN